MTDQPDEFGLDAQMQVIRDALAELLQTMTQRDTKELIANLCANVITLNLVVEQILKRLRDD